MKAASTAVCIDCGCKTTYTVKSHIEELTVREIARRLGRQKSTIAERLQRIFSLFPVNP